MKNVILHNKFTDKIRDFYVFRRYPTVKELAKYSIVGNLCNLFDLGLYIFITRFFDFWRERYLLANVVTIFLASLVRFILQKKWTFKDQSRQIRKQYLMFVFVLVAGLILNIVMIYLLVDIANMYDLIGKIIAMALGTFVVYYGSKKWVFNIKNL